MATILDSSAIGHWHHYKDLLWQHYSTCKLITPFPLTQFQVLTVVCKGLHSLDPAYILTPISRSPVHVHGSPTWLWPTRAAPCLHTGRSPFPQPGAPPWHFVSPTAFLRHKLAPTWLLHTAQSGFTATPVHPTASMQTLSELQLWYGHLLPHQTTNPWERRSCLLWLRFPVEGNSSGRLFKKQTPPISTRSSREWRQRRESSPPRSRSWLNNRTWGGGEIVPFRGLQSIAVIKPGKFRALKACATAKSKFGFLWELPNIKVTF